MNKQNKNNFYQGCGLSFLIGFILFINAFIVGDCGYILFMISLLSFLLSILFLIAGVIKTLTNICAGKDIDEKEAEMRKQYKKELKIKKQEEREKQRVLREYQKLMEKRLKYINNISQNLNTIGVLMQKLNDIAKLEPTSEMYKIKKVEDFINNGKKVIITYQALNRSIENLHTTLQKLRKYSTCSFEKEKEIIEKAKDFSNKTYTTIEKIQYTIKDMEQSIREYEQNKQQNEHIEYETSASWFFWIF